MNTTLFRPALLAAYSAASARRKSLDRPESTSRSAVTPILTVAPTGSPLMKPADSAKCARRRSRRLDGFFTVNARQDGCELLPSEAPDDVAG